MKRIDFTKKSPGTLVSATGPSGAYLAYFPAPLPPKLQFPTEMASRLTNAALALGELKGMGEMLPSSHLVVKPFTRREAVSSSRIEGTVTNFPELLLYEVDSTGSEMSEDRQEVLNYVRAMEFGLERLKTLPVSLRLMREVHERLMDGVRGENKTPGEFRERQNMIGRDGQSPADARFVPPPVLQMREALDQLERFIAYPSGLPVLIDIALIHYQFETIHPFLDGNGRLGRLLITLLLCERGCLSQPTLYLSDYFERHREDYVGLLLTVSRTGDWLAWIDFFLDAVAFQSKSAIIRCNELVSLWRSYRERFQVTGYTSNLLAVVDLLFENPVVTIGSVEKALGVTFHTARNTIEKLVAEEVLKEVTGRTKGRVYVSSEILKTLGKPDDLGKTANETAEK